MGCVMLAILILFFWFSLRDRWGRGAPSGEPRPEPEPDPAPDTGHRVCLPTRRPPPS